MATEATGDRGSTSAGTTSNTPPDRAGDRFVGGRCIWRAGDPWRDLLAEVLACESTVVAVTAKGSVRILSVADGWQMRLRGPGRSVIAGDGRKVELVRVETCTPCGLVVWSATAWSASTNLVLLLELTGDPTELELGSFDAIITRYPPARSS